MADEQTPEFLNDDAEPTNDNFVALRNHAKSLEKDLRELKAFKDETEPKLRNSALKDAGFDPESGPAKALLKIHEGEFEPEALKATASEYGLTPPGSEGTEGTPPAQLSEEDKQAIASHERGQQAFAQGTPAQPPQTMEGRLEAAEAKANETGDWSEWDRLQVEASLSR